MPVKVAINGYGRIGRRADRALYEAKRMGGDCVAVSEPGDGAITIAGVVAGPVIVQAAALESA